MGYLEILITRLILLVIDFMLCEALLCVLALVGGILGATPILNEAVVR